MRRAVLPLVALVCVALILGYQLTHAETSASDPRVFVPDPKVFEALSPSYRTSIADVYWLQMIQYYGEHLTTDNRFDSLPAMANVVTRLSPRFRQAYITGAFALIDAQRPDISYELLKRGFAANPRDWHFPSYLGFFASVYGDDPKKAAITAADWYRQASRLPGAPGWTKSVAANLLGEGGATKAAILQWGQVYAEGDKYAKEKAVKGLEEVLPKEKQARMRALAVLVGTMPKDELDQLVAELFKAYE